MGTSARFYANDTSWIVGKKRQQFMAFEFLFNSFSISSQSKQMENMFCYIQANHAIVHFPCRTPHLQGVTWNESQSYCPQYHKQGQ